MIRPQPNDGVEIPPVPSPLTGRPSPVVHRVSCEDLIRAYAQQLETDIRPYLGSLREIRLHRCPDSGFRFYFPHQTSGDDAFYRMLAKHSWYYQETKWEFEESIRFLPGQGTILEVGPGQGDFMKGCRFARSSLRVVGLELNQAAAAAARVSGLDVREESLASHARSHRENYAAVCAFQVLEHIDDPLSFLRDCVRVLKPGGLLVLAVPDSTERNPPAPLVSPGDPLNMPPHHQGLWDPVSLAFLVRLLPLRLRHLRSEPVHKDEQLTNYARLLRAEFKQRLGGCCGRLLHAAGQPVWRLALRALAPFLPAHSLLAVFEKEKTEEAPDP